MDPVIIVCAIIAGVALFRLYTVLGQRTGHDQPAQNPLEPRQSGGESQHNENEKVIQLPGRNQEAASDVPVRAGSGDLPQRLLDLQLADRSFEPAHFLTGAKSAYEMIATAFAAGDLDTLQGLLADDVYGSFKQVIEARASKGHNAHTEFRDIDKAEFAGAELLGDLARVTVDFASRQIRFVKDSAGAIIEGDPEFDELVRDRWTFARRVGDENPNWLLVATAVGD